MRKFVHTDVRQLALNFAYPLEPVFENGVLDGRLVSGSKENDFNGMINEKVGQLITDDLQEFRGQSLKVSCANDTVCLLLSGLTSYKEQELFGGIVGTGVNFAFFTGDRTLVNLESANFDKFSISEAAKHIDRDSIRSGQALFEKEVAGAYLYQHYNFIIEQKNLAFPRLTRTADLGEVAKKDDVSGEIARNVLDHSASLVACQIAGIAEFKKRDIVGIMEGSLFWKGHNYKTLVETYLGLLTEYSVTFTRIDDDSILGAAYLLGN
jgi:hexokinase